jgi:putative flavoprotein involved in K+ transport
MNATDVVIIGAGQAGLAMSHRLTGLGIGHVVLERGRLGERWHSERWDSLRLLTPNWMNALPGYPQRVDPDGYMRAVQFAAYLERYARTFAVPVVEDAAVEAVTFDGAAYDVVSAAGRWRARNVVVATGWCDVPATPPFARDLAADVAQIAPTRYRNPASVPDGGVLVVGASATGVQLAAELRAAGREVVLAVGSHSRLPRRYRGMDIFWWLQRTGNFDRTVDDVGDPASARSEPSVQLVGRPDGRDLDLATLQDAGVRLVGRAVGADGTVVRYGPDLAATVADADRRMRNVLARIDRHIDETGLASEVEDPAPPRPVVIGDTPDELDLRAEGITSVVWATGFRRSYPWLHVPALDHRGEIPQRRGVTRTPGLYVIGQRFQHYRSSNFVYGVGRDAAYIALHLAQRLALAAKR